MNKVEAIIRPEKLDVVKDALAEVGLIGLNVFHVTGSGAERAITAGSSRGVGRHEEVSGFLWRHWCIDGRGNQNQPDSL